MRSRALDRGDQIDRRRRIVNVPAGEGVGDDHAGSVDTQMELLPATDAASAMFHGGPFPFARDRQSRTVDDEMRGAGGRRSTQRRVEVLAASRERRVVGRGQIKVQHPEDRPEKAFGLAQREVKEKPKRQRGFDRHVGVLQLPGTLADASGLPFRDRVRRQPEGHVASPNQRSIVVRPVSDTVLRLVLRMHSRLHSEIMRRRPSRWPGRDEHPFPRTNAAVGLNDRAKRTERRADHDEILTPSDGKVQPGRGRMRLWKGQGEYEFANRLRFPLHSGQNTKIAGRPTAKTINSNGSPMRQ